jgi:hypothetical protein
MRTAPRSTVWLLSAVAALATLACGGKNAGDTSSLSAVTPSSASLSVALDGSSASAMPVAAQDTGSAALLQDGATADGMGVLIPTDVPCHPHLFLRTEAVSRRLNRHLYKFLGRIDALVARHPAIDTTGQVVWERVTATGLDEKFTVALVSDQTYTWKLELRQGATGDFTTVFSGQVDRTGVTGPHQGTGTLTLDLTALKAVVPAEPAQGTIAVSFDVNPTSRQVVLDAREVSWDVGDDPSDLAPVAPRNAHYVFFREPGKGGSLKAADQMVFTCPANPELKRADVELVHQWYLVDGAVHGRSDAQMVNGQLSATQRIAGVTCHQKPVGGMFTEGYWQMKLEDGGAVVVAGSHESGTGTPCDPAFGPVPALDSTTGDFDFSAVDFTDATPYPFPGQVP